MQRLVWGLMWIVTWVACLLVALAETAEAASPELSRPRPPLVVILAPDLTWANAPEQLGGWAKASLTLRSVSIGRRAADSYLTIGKGRRSGGLGEDEGMRVLEWADLQRRDVEQRYGGRLGALGQVLADHGIPLTLVASDPAAAAAASDEHGLVHRFVLAGASAFEPALKDPAGVVMIETPIESLDEALDRSEANGPDGGSGGYCTVVVSTVSPPREPVHLGAFAVSPACGLGTGRLVSPSTHQPGYVTLTDVAPTVLSLAGVPVPETLFDGGPVQVSGATTVADLLAQDREAIVGRRSEHPVMWTLIVANLLGVLLALSRPSSRRFVVAFLLALPASTLLVMAIPWASAGVVGGVAVILAIAGVLAGVATLAVAGRDDMTLLVGGLCVLTVLVIGVDAATGGRLELNSPLANNTIYAGRFTGMGNVPYGFFVGACIASGMLALRRWTSRAVVPLAIGLVAAAIVDGAPFFGADVGGVLAAVPAFGLLVLLASGRFTVRHLAILGVAGIGFIGTFAAVDVVGGGSRETHIGRTLTGGRLADAVARKGLAALQSFSGNWFGLLVLLAIVVAVVLWHRVPRDRPVVAGFWAFVVAATLGTLLNDSGVAVGGAMAAVAIPVFLALAPPGLRMNGPLGHSVLEERVPAET
jgi:hypothetical protein